MLCQLAWSVLYWISKNLLLFSDAVVHCSWVLPAWAVAMKSSKVTGRTAATAGADTAMRIWSPAWVVLLAQVVSPPSPCRYTLKEMLLILVPDARMEPDMAPDPVVGPGAAAILTILLPLTDISGEPDNSESVTPADCRSNSEVKPRLL